MSDSPVLTALIITGDRRKFYDSPEWRRIRKLALARDRNTCQQCKDKGIYNKANTVHHIKEIESFPELGLTLSNLLCVCHACHDEIHGRNAESLNEIKKEPIIPERW